MCAHVTDGGCCCCVQSARNDKMRINSQRNLGAAMELAAVRPPPPSAPHPTLPAPIQLTASLPAPRPLTVSISLVVHPAHKTKGS